MNTTKAKHTSHVQPSSRDPITNWLDVFTKLLAVPPAEKARIRDELEDHLRMRVEDLLILGMTEPEAVQKAVAELGETAELAKGFKEARTSSRRRLLMHTALFAAAGLALTMSVANILPGSNHTMPATSPAEIALAQPEQGEQRNGYLGYDIEGGLLEDVLMNLGEAAGSRVFVHWSSLDLVGIDREMEVGAIPSKGLELSKVRELLNSMLGLEGGDELTARDDDGLLEFATVSYFDRRELITLDHDVSDLVPADHILDYTSEAENLRNGSMQVIEPSIWNSDIGAVVVNGSQLSVRAPERVQPMTEDREVAALLVHAPGATQLGGGRERQVERPGSGVQVVREAAVRGAFEPHATGVKRREQACCRPAPRGPPGPLVRGGGLGSGSGKDLLEGLEDAVGVARRHRDALEPA